MTSRRFLVRCVVDHTALKYVCECACCYTVQHCVDDGEALICADRAACAARQKGNAAMATYTMERTSADYAGFYHGGNEMSATDVGARLNALEQAREETFAMLTEERATSQALRADVRRYRALADEAARGMANAGRDVDALRAQLDQAHQHVGALLAIQCGTVQDYADVQRELAARAAARTWLRREA
jgi:O6-methylguanine-DNA--protein-cysteine methyltransferase